MAKENNNKAFKSTPIGMIPKDWKYISFGDVFEFIPTISLSRAQLTLEITENSIYNIHYGDIHATYKANILDFDKEKRIPLIKDEVEIKSLNLLKDGDLAIADASEDYDGVAASIELANIDGKKVTGGLHTFIARDISGLTEIGFRNYVLKNPMVALELKKLATGSKVYGISKTNLSSLYILLPTGKEQKRIAKIFHTWDESIETLETLIKRKEHRKKALMQQLLTGKKRFKEFEGEKWKKFQLDKIADVRDGTHESPKYFQAGIKFITSKNIKNGQLDFSSTSYISQEDADNFNRRSKVTKGDILMSMIGTIGNSVLVDFEPDFCIKNVGLIKSQQVNARYLIQYFHSHLFQNYLLGKLDGGIQKFISLSGLRELNIPIPSPKEQTAIACILETADEEIQTLKTQLEKCRQQKKGLMQVLLTGKKRVNF